MPMLLPILNPDEGRLDMAVAIGYRELGPPT